MMIHKCASTFQIGSKIPCYTFCDSSALATDSVTDPNETALLRHTSVPTNDDRGIVRPYTMTQNETVYIRPLYGFLSPARLPIPPRAHGWE
jgi:hypothetical protein